MPYRREKIEEWMRHELAELLQRDFRTPGVLLTIVGVRVSDDGQHATAHFSVFPETKREEVGGMLQRAIYHIQQAINKKMQIRPVPKIAFSLDVSGEEASRIDQILRSADQAERSAPAKSHGRSKPRRVRKTA